MTAGEARADDGLTSAEWHAIVDAVREGVVVHDAAGRIISANEAAARTLGLTTGQLLGLDPLDPRWGAIRPDGSPVSGEDHPAMVTLRTGEAVSDEVMGVALPDGTRRWLRVSAHPLTTPADDRRVVATFVDVTEEHEREIGYRALAESTSDLVARVSGGVLRYASPAALRFLGPVEGMTALDLVTRVIHPDDLGTFLTAMDELDAGLTTDAEILLLRVRNTEGNWHWFDTRVWRAAGIPGEVVVARDVSERVSMERELADAEELFRQAFEEAPVGMAMTSADADAPVIVRANRRYADILGCSVEEVVGRSASDFTLADDHEASIAARRRLLNGTSTHERMHIRIRRVDGTTPWHVLTRTVLRDQAGAPRYVLAQLEDAGAAQDMVTKLSTLAHTDPLTGLMNRRGLETELAAMLADAYAMAHTALFFLDLEGFKAVNDQLGHVAGDEVLCQVGARLTQLTRGHDIVARVGGDEFVVIARHVGTNAAATLVAERLADTLLEVHGNPPLVVRASVGSTRPVPGDTAAAVIDRADQDMYRHKRRAGL